MIILNSFNPGTQMPGGEHSGKAIAQMMLDAPGYIRWSLEDGGLKGWLRSSIETFIAIFDAKPFIERCMGEKCQNPVTRFSFRNGAPGVYFWCDRCSAEAEFCTSGVTYARTYLDAVRYLFFNRALRQDFPRLVKQLAEAKGFGGSVTTAKAIQFFTPPAPPVSPIPVMHSP